MNENLTYNKRVALFLYKKFFLSNYFDDYQKYKDEPVNVAHIKMQKMIYILNAKGISIGDYSFSWNIRGPYSKELLCFIKDIDNSIVSDSEIDDWETLGLCSIERNVELLIDKLKIRKYNNYSEGWIELLSSVLYISQVVFPGFCKEDVLDELYNRKVQYKGKETECSEAWEVLCDEGLVE